MRPLKLLAALLALLAAGAAAALIASAGTTPTAVRAALAASETVQGAPDHTLGLSKVTVPPKAQLALHHHDGTQVAHIDKGTLTYTVQEGSVDVMRGSADKPRKVRTIAAGQTGQIRAGQWIVEQPTVIHRAANRGRETVQIHLATLLPTGSPPSTPN